MKRIFHCLLGHIWSLNASQLYNIEDSTCIPSQMPSCGFSDLWQIELQVHHFLSFFLFAAIVHFMHHVLPFPFLDRVYSKRTNSSICIESTLFYFCTYGPYFCNWPPFPVSTCNRKNCPDSNASRFGVKYSGSRALVVSDRFGYAKGATVSFGINDAFTPAFTACWSCIAPAMN